MIFIYAMLTYFKDNFTVRSHFKRSVSIVRRCWSQMIIIIGEVRKSFWSSTWVYHREDIGQFLKTRRGTEPQNVGLCFEKYQILSQSRKCFERNNFIYIGDTRYWFMGKTNHFKPTVQVHGKLLLSKMFQIIFREVNYPPFI